MQRDAVELHRHPRYFIIISFRKSVIQIFFCWSTTFVTSRYGYVVYYINENGKVKRSS
jgi:hypothetical protein